MKKNLFMVAAVALMALVLFAVLITYTKSIWFGILAGLAIAMAGIFIFTKDALMRKRTAVFGLALVVLFCIFNYGFLDNTIITRTLNNSRPDMLTSIESQIGDLQQQLSQMETGDTTDPSGSNEDQKSKEDLENLLKKLESQLLRLYLPFFMQVVNSAAADIRFRAVCTALAHRLLTRCQAGLRLR